MRLGGKKVRLIGGDGERVRKLYNCDDGGESGESGEIVERHRHRYDVDKEMFSEYCSVLGGDMKIVGESDYYTIRTAYGWPSEHGAYRGPVAGLPFQRCSKSPTQRFILTPVLSISCSTREFSDL